MSGLPDLVAILVVAIAAAVVGRRVVAWMRSFRAAPRREIPIASQGAQVCGGCDGCGGCERPGGR
jgi:hypothetical protein